MKAGVVLLLTVALPVLAADGLKVKPGLWETTTEISTAGLTLPESVTANMTREQRARMEATMKQTAAEGARTRTAKRCVTAEQVKEGAFFAPTTAEQSPNCRHEVVSATTKRQEITMSCDDGKITSSMRVVLNVIDSGNVEGEALGNVNLQAGAMPPMPQSTSTEMKFKSHWLGANCTDADAK